MNNVERALKKVKGLSEDQARALLVWLESKPRSEVPTRSSKRLKKASPDGLAQWYRSVRGKTDWEPARMPLELVKPVRL